MANLYETLAARFPADRTRPFACLPEGRVLDYAGVERASARYAALLVRLEVGVGDRVAVQTGKSIDMLMLYLGCLRVGAVFLPLNPAYPAGELAYFLDDAQPALFVCDPAREAEARALAAGQLGLRVETLGEAGEGTLPAMAAGTPDAFATVPRADDDLAAILYTSGTTGRSKGAMLSHGNLASNALTLVAQWRFTGDDVLLHMLPIFHTHGLFVAHQCDAGRRRIAAVRAALRRRAGDGAAAARHSDDGRADLLHPPARRTGIRPRSGR